MFSAYLSVSLAVSTLEPLVVRDKAKLESPTPPYISRDCHAPLLACCVAFCSLKASRRGSSHIYPKRASLERLEIEILKLVSYSATPEQRKEMASGAAGA